MQNFQSALHDHVLIAIPFDLNGETAVYVAEHQNCIPNYGFGFTMSGTMETLNLGAAGEVDDTWRQPWQTCRMKMKLLFTAAVLSAAAQAAAEGDCTEDAMIVFDGSGSMAEMGFNDIDEPRIFEARRAIERSIPPISQFRRLGLVIYGPGGADECSGLDLRFPPAANAGDRVIGEIHALEPAGDTALVSAVQMAAEVFGNGAVPGTIVLITDGKETCGGAPCQLATALAGTDITVHVIGFKIRGDFFDFSGSGHDQYTSAQTPARCLAESTGGLYLDTETVEELIEALDQTLGCPMLSMRTLKAGRS